MVYYLHFILLLFFTTVYGQSSKFPNTDSNRIVGGHVAKAGQFPYQVSVQVFGAHSCGGTILNEEWILTAAHCLTYQLQFYTVKAGLLGIHDRGIQIQKRNAQTIFVHPKYPGSVTVAPYDIGLIKLTAPLTFNKKVDRIDLPAEGSVHTGLATVSGWGSTSNTTKPNYPEILQFIDLPLVPFKECKEFLDKRNNTALVESNICTGPLDGNVATCSGDSGGPLVQENKIIGIVSWGELPCGANGDPSVYTRVSAHIDFINDVISKN